MSKLIINCDDFGMSEEINLAVLQAYRCNILSSASLLVTGSALEHAVDIYQQCEKIGVSLHIDLDDYLGFGPKKHLGSTISDINRKHLQYMISNHSNCILYAIESQINQALKLGFRLTHIDGHHHAHLFPGIIEQVISVIKKYGIDRIRFFDDFYEKNYFYSTNLKRWLKKENIKYPDKFIDFSFFKNNFQTLSYETCEMMVHIAINKNFGESWRTIQFNRLISDQFCRTLLESKIKLINFEEF